MMGIEERMVLAGQRAYGKTQEACKKRQRAIYKIN